MPQWAWPDSNRRPLPCEGSIIATRPQARYRIGILSPFKGFSWNRTNSYKPRAIPVQHAITPRRSDLSCPWRYRPYCSRGADSPNQGRRTAHKLAILGSSLGLWYPRTSPSLCPSVGRLSDDYKNCTWTSRASFVGYSSTNAGTNPRFFNPLLSRSATSTEVMIRSLSGSTISRSSGMPRS